jgi:malate/lactate dehydrogenase
MIELPQAEKPLNGLCMEIDDCAYDLVDEITQCYELEKGFDQIDVAILVGAMPRGPGMERKDLLEKNAKIFETQGKALDKFAKKSVKVVVIGNPCNTNALITSEHAPSIPKKNITSMTRLDQSRA